MEINKDAITSWPMIIVLACLAGFVILSWNIYDHFNYILLEKANLSNWTSPLSQLQICLGICIPPIAGWLADYYTKKNKNYLFITLSLGITAMLFIGTAIITGDSFGNTMQQILPAMMILWMTGMHLFFSPAINLIKKSAKKAHLPIAIGLIFFVADIIYALHTYIIHGVEALGSVWIFAGAGIALSILGYYYFKFSKGQVQYLHPDDPADPIQKWIIRAIAIGITGGLCKGLLKADTLQNLSHFLPLNDIVSAIFFISAFLVFGFAFILKNEAVNKIFIIGLILNFLGFLMTFIASGTITSLFALLFIITGMSMVSLHIYTVALLHVPEKQYNFAFGLFYAGYSLTGFIFKLLLHQ